MLVVSLSSVPPRFGHLGPTLESLLAQTAPAAEIRLHVPRRYRRFPDWDGRLPAVPAGVEIVRCDADLGPATKALPAARALRGTEAELLFCDDDAIYPPDWSRAFLDERRRVPDAAIAIAGFEADRLAPATMARAHRPRAVRRWRKTDLEFQARLAWHRLRHRFGGAARPGPGRRVIRRAGYVDIFEGNAGVLVRPDWFDDAAFDIPDFAMGVDDVWLSGALARQGIPVWLMGNRREQVYHGGVHVDPLLGPARRADNRRVLEHLRAAYGIWP